MRRIKQAKPSAALIVAVVALVAALGGGAVAGVAVTSLNKKDKKQVTKIAKKQARKLDKKIELLPGPPGEKGDQGTQGEPGEPATSLRAFVKQDGTLLYGDGVTQSAKSAAGTYDITFSRSVADCVPVATPGNHGSTSGDFNGNFAFADAHASVINNDSDAITVRFFRSSTGSLSDTSFNLAVFCP
jgi:hypothetical protein